MKFYLKKNRSFLYLYFINFLFLLLIACSQLPKPLPELWENVKIEQVNPNKLSEYEYFLDNIIKHPEFSLEKISKKHAHLLLKLICSYQLAHFMLPSQDSQEKLFDNYYPIWEKLPYQQELIDSLKGDYELRDLLKIIESRNIRAEKILKQCIQDWEKNSNYSPDWLESLDREWETGGIIRESKEKSQENLLFFCNNLEFLELPDSDQIENAKYLAEFRQNNFQNLDKLQANFLKRFRLFRVGADSSTELYTDVVESIVTKKFSVLREMRRKKDWTESDLEIIDQAKKKLYYFGLKKRLLDRSYNFHLDKNTYLNDLSVIFFFHTHPYDPRIPHLKTPSKQDQIMTFRMGPAIVFDVQENFVDVYSVVSGEVDKIHRFLK